MNSTPLRVDDYVAAATAPNMRRSYIEGADPFGQQRIESTLQATTSLATPLSARAVAGRATATGHVACRQAQVFSGGVLFKRCRRDGQVDPQSPLRTGDYLIRAQFSKTLDDTGDLFVRLVNNLVKYAQQKLQEFHLQQQKRIDLLIAQFKSVLMAYQ